MEFTRLLEIVGDEPVFETSLLLAGAVNPADVRRQLSRWVKAGRLYQLRRGLYALALPSQRAKPYPFIVANSVVRSFLRQLAGCAGLLRSHPRGDAVLATTVIRRHVILQLQHHDRASLPAGKPLEGVKKWKSLKSVCPGLMFI